MNATLKGANENLIMQMSFMRMQMRMCMYVMHEFALGMSSAKILVDYANMKATI